ncbi:MAG: CotH kinase family protein [Bacteroidales bacterium]|nr:CotH kinase family protein [Bacteroidales bacterium]
MRVLHVILVSLLFIFNASGQSHWESIVMADDFWRYLPALTEPPAGWNEAGFDDDGWSEAQGGIGYGDGDDQTLIDPVNSLYLRTAFNVSPGVEVLTLILDIDYDDAFVAYLNGDEVARSENVTDPFPAYNSTLLYDHEAQMYSGGMPERFGIDRSLLDTGLNVLAVHVLNNGIGSSDLTSLVFLNAEIGGDDLIFEQTPDWFIPPVAFTGSRLPVIKINTYGVHIPDEPRIAAEMGIIYNGPGQLNSVNDTFNEYDGRITIETRGQSSQMFPKKSYRLETQDSLGENLNISLLGMPPENDWILYAPYSDKSMLRNAVTFELGRKLDYYCSRTVFCELFLNEEYRGVYVLMEKIKRDDDRVDIAKLKLTDNYGNELTGGYIFKVDKIDPGYIEGSDGFRSSPDPSYPNAMDIIYQYFDPKPDELTPVQKEYLKERIIEAEAVLISDYFDDPDIGYNRYLNTGSFVDFMLINEISKEVDKYRYSSYFYKKRDSRGGEFFAGPLWDFNLGYGNVDYWPEGINTAGWLFDDVQPYDWSLIFWWKRLMEDDWFRDLASTRWRYLRENDFSDANIQVLIDSLTGLIDEAQERNYQRWPILGEYVWPNYNWAGNVYQDEVDYFSDWLFERLHWMDANFNEEFLNPVITISRIGISDNNLNYRIKLKDDLFNHSKLLKKYFKLTTSNPFIFIDSIYYEAPGAAVLSLGIESGISYNGSEISLEIDHRVLNGFRTLVTKEITVDVSATVFDDSFEVEIYASGKNIILRTNYPNSLPDHMRVYSMTGRLVEIHALERTGFNKVRTSLQPGIYVVTLEPLETQEVPVHQKVLIR